MPDLNPNLKPKKENAMKRLIALSLMSLIAAAPVALSGCDRTVEYKSSESSDGNKVKSETKKVTEHADGSVTETKDKTVTHVDNR